MNAIQFLLEEHREFRRIFRQFEEAGERAHKTKQKLATKLLEELRAHSQIEEQIFYPAARKKADKELEGVILEGIEEHRIADFMMERLENATPADDTFDARFKALSESVKHHLKEEEGKLFPKARKLLRDDLERLGSKMEALDKQLEG
ncbi:MAG TPA: hemerythrin domain-containing protein [Anaerolineales bacterium]